MCRTESVLVPYKFFSNSPNSMNFPLAKSDSKAARLTKWYSRPFRSCILKFLVVSEPQKEYSGLHSQVKVLKIISTKMHRSRQICLKEGDVMCPRICFLFCVCVCVLTWDSNGKLFWFNGQKPPTQLIVAAVCRANQSDGAFPTGRLVIEGHLFVGQDVIIV